MPTSSSKQDAKQLKLSLVIPAHNEEKYIWTCLEYALRHADGCIDEIIVIDNASTDKTREVAEAFPNVKVVSEKNKWLTFARRRGHMESTWDIIAYIDADTQMPPWWAKKIKQYMESNEKLWFISGPYSYYDLPRHKKFTTRFLQRVFIYPTYLIAWYWGVGGNFAIKRTVLDKIGWFDTTIEFYGEDTDIARRASKASKTLFKPGLVMPTSGRRFVWEGMIKTFYRYVINFLSQAVAHKSATKTSKDFR